MSVNLSDARVKIGQLVAELQNLDDAYKQAQNLLKHIEADAIQNLSNMGLQIVFSNDVTIPTPLPSDPEALGDLAASSQNLLAMQITRTWAELKATAEQAHSYCVLRTQQAGEVEVNAPTVPQPAATAPAAPAAPAAPVQQNVSVNPLRTHPV